MELIKDTASLEVLCAQLRREGFVAVDTEFIREKTYYPKLCLIQVASPAAQGVIDPLIPQLDLTPWFDLMADFQVTKVFHAARQDIEIFHHLAGVIPQPLFDTQVAAQALGFGEAISYEALVKNILKSQLDKGARFTDWAKRPLSERQLAYALADVTYLRELYEIMRGRLADLGRDAWIGEEMEILASPATYRPHLRDAWKRLKLRPRSARHAALLRELAAWREQEAQQRDVPRGRILSDDVLAEIAAAAPQTPEELAHLRGCGGFGAKIKSGILAAVAAGREADASDIALPAKSPSQNGEGAIDLLRLLLRHVCEEQKVAAPLVATREDLEALADGRRDTAVLQGWRYEVFGEQAEALLAGRLTLRFDPSVRRIRWAKDRH